MFQEIYVIEEKEELTKELKELFKNQGNLRFRKTSTSELQLIFRNLPQLIIINDDSIEDFNLLFNKYKELPDSDKEFMKNMIIERRKQMDKQLGEDNDG